MEYKLDKIGRKLFLFYCTECGTELYIRADYVAKHKKLCRSCFKKSNWADPENRARYMKTFVYRQPKPFKLPYGESSFNLLYRSYERGAINRNLEFNLTKDEFREITSKNCEYCGAPPLQKSPHKNIRINGHYIHNGIDRKDPSVGYTVDNCVASCSKCNYAKQSLSFDDFIQHIIKIYNNIVATK